MTRAWTASLVAALLAAPGAARGNGEDPVHPPATVSERFVLSSCSPCVRQVATARAGASAESAQVDLHGGTLRVGMLRLRGETIAYVQVGDRQAQIQLPAWEVPTTLYLAVSDLPILAAALDQAAATIEQVRRD